MQPNILFITADQWRGECLSHAGHPMVKTPNLDALAADGVSFRKHFANCAPCAPSRASIHTGMYLQNHRSGTNMTPLDRRHSNWALELRKTGYDPVLLGYTDTVPDPRYHTDNDPALMNWEGVLPGLKAILDMNTDPGEWYSYCKLKGYDVPAFKPLLYALREPGPEWEDGADAPKPLTIHKDDNDTAFLFDRTMDYIGDQNGPWAAHLSIMRPHPPWIASEPYNALYDPDEVPQIARHDTSEEEGTQHPWLAYQLGRKIYHAPSNEKALRRHKAVYYGLMTEVDYHMGRLIGFLKERGLYDNTLIVFTSDHGEQMGDHWLRGKCGYFDASYHVPLIVRDPRSKTDKTRGTQIHSFTENVDLMPTMLDFAGVDIPVQCDGHPLTHFLETGTAPGGWRREAHWEFDFRDPTNTEAEDTLGLSLHQCVMNIIRDDKYKYVHFAGLKPLLFDLQADPGEFKNLADDPAYQGVLLDYAQKMLSWRMTHDEQTLTHYAITHEGLKERAAPRYPLFAGS
jgi:arylsulfatase A-like enzyme